MVPEEWLRRCAGIAGVGEAAGDHVRFKLSQVGAARRGARGAARRSASTSASRARATSCRRSAASAPLDAGAVVRRTAARLPARRARLVRLPAHASASAAASPTTWASARPSWCWRWLDRLRATQASVRARRSSSCRARCVFNWIEEAARFAPKLRVLDFSGAGPLGRCVSTATTSCSPPTARCAATPCVLKDVAFDYVILDEAQAIKNANTAAAKAARLLRAKHRLALSGTPIENHLGELWSLFEFLNPGLLGTASAFARHGAAPPRSRIRSALDVLSRGVRPFILRRTKAQVAPELPARTEQTIHCELAGRAARAVRRAARSLPRGAARRASRATGSRSRRCTCSRRCCGCARRRAIPACRPAARRRAVREVRRAAAAARGGASKKGTRRWSSRSSPACSRCCGRGSTRPG